MYAIFFLIFFSIAISLNAQNHCKDFLILEGNEPIITFGFDTTKNYYIITQPFTNRKRIYVNKDTSNTFFDISTPVFSPDGNKWACFVYDNINWHLLYNNQLIKLPAINPGEIVFSGNSEQIIYSYFIDNFEYIIHNEKTYKIQYKSSKLFSNFWGNVISFVIQRGNTQVVVINGKESTQYDNVNPIGFWHDNEFIYAGYNGNNVQLIKNFSTFSNESFTSIDDSKINLQGTALSIICKNNSNQIYNYFYSDEFYEPLVSKPYDSAWDLKLYPFDNLFTYKAIYNSKEIVLINSTEYWAGETSGDLNFTYDGSESFYISCVTNCSIIVNGRQYRLNQDIPIDMKICKKPNSDTFAYTTPNTLVIRELNTKMLYSGMMVDYTSTPRYNRFEDRYEAFGVINNRLYLLTCKF